MSTLSADNFGLLIAYLLPGFVCLCGLRPFVAPVHAWLGPSATDAPTVGGFLFATLGSTAAGLIVSAVRWALVDRLHHSTGIPEPRWNFSRLTANLPAFQAMVEYHYRYYQFHSNMLVAVSFLYGTVLLAEKRLPGQDVGTDFAFLLVASVLFFGSRDTLRKYYTRTAELLAPAAREAGQAATLVATAAGHSALPRRKTS